MPENSFVRSASADGDEFEGAENSIVKKYIYAAMALLILTAVLLIFLRFILYLW
ncbi:MAG: hypothetical protein WC408_02605 [Candidatus Micrarchaeia archaeon]|jgi:hypothetical protein